MKRRDINRLFSYGMAALIISFLGSLVILAWLLFNFGASHNIGQVVSATQGALLHLKDDSERLLTTTDLERDKARWRDSIARFQARLKQLQETEEYQEEVRELERFWQTVHAQSERVQEQFRSPLLQADQMIDKSLLRRLGENFRQNTTSDFFFALNTARNAIVYMTQYEDFMLEEFARLMARHRQREEARLNRLTILSVLLPAAIWVLLSLFFWFLSRWVRGNEAALMEENLQRREAQAELRTYQSQLEDLVKARTSELQQTMQELRRAKDESEAANRAKSTFLANMSHELRTPLNAILGFSQIMGFDQAIPRNARSNLDTINRAGEHLLAMINDILDLSKIESGRIELRPEPFDLHRLLSDIGEMIRSRAQAKDLLFNLRQDPDLSRYISADQGKIRQILINLLGNAVKFTEQGEVTLRGRTRQANGALRLELEVEDTGPGIPAEMQGRIFEPFVQAKDAQNETKGTGLGLSISQAFVQLMGGVLEVQSRPGEGALFRVELPVESANPGAVTPEAIHRRVLALAPGQQAPRVLVADDSEENRRLLTTLLSGIGLEVREAVDGEEAESMFRRWQPRLIWMDMRMPGIDGYQAARQIRGLPGGKDVVIIAVTASAFKDQEANIRAAGCDAIVRKPYCQHQIFEAMGEHLGLEYLYEEPADPPADKTGLEDRQLAREGLSALSSEQREDLYEAVLTCDVEAVDALLEVISEQHRQLAETLRQMAADFDYSGIVALLDGLEDGAGRESEASNHLG